MPNYEEPDDLETVREMTRERAAAKERFDATDAALRDAIRVALANGATAPAVATVTGMSKQRIYQIRDNTR